MNNRFYELERRCAQYRRKKNIKSLAFGAVIGLFLVAIAFYAGVFNEHLVNENGDSEVVFENEESEYNEDIDDGYIAQTTDEIMNEELGQPENIELNSVATKDVEEIIEDEIKDNTTIEPKVVDIEKVVSKEIEVVEKKILFLEPNISLDLLKKKVDKKPTLDTKKVDNPIVNMKKEFTVSHSIETALLISQNYYDKGDFKSSLKWAIEASKINAKAPKPWIMYARAKAKSGDKEIAIKALQTYLSEFYSDEASLLLDEIKSIKR